MWKKLSFVGAILLISLCVSASVFADSFNYQDQTKEKKAIKEKMLNAIDYYTTLKGTYHTIIKPLNVDETENFDINETGTPKSYAKVVNAKNDNTVETIVDGENATFVNKGKKLYSKKPLMKTSKFDKSQPRVQKADDGTKIYVYRPDPAFAYQADSVAFPQTYAFWLNKFEISGKEDYLGRNATVITGNLPKELQQKHDAVTFKMWIDSKTGVLLKLIEQKADGEITNEIDVTSIQFDGELNNSTFIPTKIPNGYKDITTVSPVPKNK